MQRVPMGVDRHNCTLFAVSKNHYMIANKKQVQGPGLFQLTLSPPNMWIENTLPPQGNPLYVDSKAKILSYEKSQMTKGAFNKNSCVRSLILI